MRKIAYVVLFCCCIQYTLYAQEKNEIDSLFKLTEKAFNLSQTSKLSEAIKLSNEILEYEKTHKNDSLRGTTYNILAISYTYLKDTLQSGQYFLKALELYKKGSDTTRLISAYNNLGVFYRDYASNIEKSNTYFDLANTFANLSNDLDATIHPNYNLGSNYIDKAIISGNKEYYKKAIIHLEKAIQLIDSSKKETSQYVKSNCYNLLSYTYFKLKDYEISREYYQKALKNAEANGNLESIANTYGDRSILFEEVGKYKEANEMLKKLSVITDSIYKVEKFAEAKAIESEYFVKENKERLKFVEKEKELQEKVISKSKTYNIVLVIFSGLLLLGVYYIFIKNRELKSAKEKAEKLSKVKSDFYSEISHELRTPLYAVIELSALLLKENLNVKHKEYLESLKFSGNHLLSLINNVLQLNKVESGKMKIEMLDFDLKVLVSNIIESLEYALRDSNNKIHLDYDNTIPQVITGDSLKLSQVLINLISNAIKFTHNGNIYVKINQLEDNDKMIKVYFDVSDDGLGIPEDKQEQVFLDFYQEHVKNENTYKGTGLGLSIVKRIVNAMGSDIGIKSKEGEGASFFFSLEFSKSIKAKIPKVEYTDNVNAIKNSNFLIVDDNKINQIVTKKVLEQLDMKSKAVDSGEKAIDIITREKFDCVLMDLHMPGLDGYETTKRIRKFNKDIVIVALTAASNEEVEDKINNTEINGFVLKPFLTEDFVSTISKAITQAKLKAS